MKKNIIKPLVALGVCLVVILVLFVGYGIYERRNEANDYVGVCEKYGYVKYWDKKDSDESTAILIKTYDEYEQWKADILNGGSTASSYKEKLESYDEAFFTEKDLIMEYYTLNSGSVQVAFKRLDVVDGVADIITKRNSPGLGGASSADMAYWAVFVEVSKAENITDVK